MPLITVHPPAETRKGDLIPWSCGSQQKSSSDSKIITIFISHKYVKISNIADFSLHPRSQPQSVLPDYSPTKRDWLYRGPCIKQTIRSHPHFNPLHYVHLPEIPALLNQGCNWDFSKFPPQAWNRPFQVAQRPSWNSSCRLNTSPSIYSSNSRRPQCLSYPHSKN